MTMSSTLTSESLYQDADGIGIKVTRIPIDNPVLRVSSALHMRMRLQAQTLRV